MVVVAAAGAAEAMVEIRVPFPGSIRVTIRDLEGYYNNS